MMFLQRRHTATASPVKTGGRLMKRMSTMLERVGAVLVEEDEEKIEVSLSSSQSSMDDIRRPSGLGATIEEHASVMRAYRVQVPPLPPYPRPSQYLRPEIPPLPVEVLATILSLLPRTSVPALALVSRDFLSVAQTVLYGDLGMRDVRNPDTLWIFLVTRRDLPSLTHTLRVPAWPSPQNWAYLTHASAIPLPPTPTPAQDTFVDTPDTLLLNLTTLESPPHLVILLATSHRHPLIDPSITISTPVCAGFRPTTTLKSLPPSARCLRFMFKSVGKRTEEKTPRSAVVVCPAIEELEIEEECGEECWCSIVPHLKSLRVLVMRKPETAQIKAAKEELDERFPLPKRSRTRSTSSAISHSCHSMVVSERARATHLANACPALQRVVFLYAVQWHRPSSSPPLS